MGGNTRAAAVRPDDTTLGLFPSLSESAARPYNLPTATDMLTKFKASAPMSCAAARKPLSPDPPPDPRADGRLPCGRSYHGSTPGAKHKNALQIGLVALMELFCVMCPIPYSTDPSVDVPAVDAVDDRGATVKVPAFCVLNVLESHYQDVFDAYDTYPADFTLWLVTQLWNDLKLALATTDSYGSRTLTRALLHARTLEGFRSLMNGSVPNHVSLPSSSGGSGGGGTSAPVNNGGKGQKQNDNRSSSAKAGNRAPDNFCFQYARPSNPREGEPGGGSLTVLLCLPTGGGRRASATFASPARTASSPTSRRMTTRRVASAAAGSKRGTRSIATASLERNGAV